MLSSGSGELVLLEPGFNSLPGSAILTNSKLGILIPSYVDFICGQILLLLLRWCFSCCDCSRKETCCSCCILVHVKLFYADVLLTIVSAATDVAVLKFVCLFIFCIIICSLVCIWSLKDMMMSIVIYVYPGKKAGGLRSYKSCIQCIIILYK